MYVGITRARNRLYLSRAHERTLFNQTRYNEPSRVLEEIPDRLLEDEWTPKRRAAFRDEEPAPPFYGRKPAEERSRRPAMEMHQLGKPKLTFNGSNLSSIPGVTKGFAQSKARSGSEDAMKRMFSTGDRVLHRKFGAGVVREITGSGASARIIIAFTAYGTKEFDLAMAPIVKLEE